MKLTNKARNELRAVLRNAERGFTYIQRDDIAVCHRRSQATTTLDYIRPNDGKVLTEVEKSYGSDLCGLETAIGLLGQFLATH